MGESFTLLTKRNPYDTHVIANPFAARISDVNVVLVGGFVAELRIYFTSKFGNHYLTLY